jgi:acyl-CoA thioester hydrolase
MRPPAAVPTDRNAYPFATEVRVRLSETDAVGIVYFGSFSTYMDVGRMDFLDHLGLGGFGAASPAHKLPPGAVAAAHLQFHSPARYNDTLTIHVRVADIGRTSYTFQFLMTDKRRPHVVATGSLTLVWLDGDFRPVPVPDGFRKAIDDFQKTAA